MISTAEYILIFCLLFLMILLLVQALSSYRTEDPRTVLTKVMKHIKNAPQTPHPSHHPHSVRAEVAHPSRVKPTDQNTTLYYNVYPYYGSEQYQQDMRLLQEVCHHGSDRKFVVDCYPLSTQDTTQMTGYDQSRIQSNLFFNIRPAVHQFAESKNYYHLAAVILLFYHIIFKMEGADGSLFLYPTYDAKGLVSSFKYALILNTMTNQVVLYLTASQAFSDLDGTGPISIPFPKMNKDLLDTFYYAHSVPISYRKSFGALMRNMINPLWDQHAELMANYPDSTIDLPVEVGCKLVIPILIPFYIYFSLKYTNSNCE